MHAAHVTNAKLINLSMLRKNMRTIGLAYRIIVLTTGVLLNSVPEKRNFFWQRKRCFSYWRHIGYWIWMHLNKKTFFCKIASIKTMLYQNVQSILLENLMNVIGKLTKNLATTVILLYRNKFKASEVIRFHKSKNIV